ncbi:MAG TPA: [Fe-Fe] hydrogenase large subunit C-terminal domain-containing protein, partial [Verrucomicrobiae bacterium]
MNHLNPIYTERRECQDCYKCVRNCPVKAIRVEGGYASVIAEFCIVCGHCVEVCPNGAKRVRDDLAAARQLLARKPSVFVSLAPSFVSEFPGVQPAQWVAALKQLGFAGVSETALGAQQVSAQAAALLAANPTRVLASSACPTVVAYLQKHRPNGAALLTGLMSP